MIQHAMLQPAVALAVWTLVMLHWMLFTRLPALKAAGVRLDTLVGGKGTDADGVLDARAQWKAHNYNHLLEQPVLFYALVATLAIAGVADLPTRLLAWSYVALRVAHSLWQATVNRVSIRFRLFGAGTLVLVALAARTAWEVF